MGRGVTEEEKRTPKIKMIQSSGNEVEEEVLGLLMGIPGKKKRGSGRENWRIGEIGMRGKQ